MFTSTLKLVQMSNVLNRWCLEDYSQLNVWSAGGVHTKKNSLLLLHALCIIIMERVAELHIHILLAQWVVPQNTHTHLLEHVCAESENFNVNMTRDQSAILGWLGNI